MHKSEAVISAIEACLARQGSSHWDESFLALVERMGAAQVMVFSYAPNAATCLLSRNFRARALGVRLGAEYLQGWFRHDPLFPMALGMAPGTVRRIDSREIADGMPAEYRARFFKRPGLAGKIAILTAGLGEKIAVNLYRAEKVTGSPPPALEAIIGRLALAHFEACNELGFPAPLAVLSERERAVCLGMLAGKKAETIAAELGIAASTVVTYRIRAYQKLGISSRGSLFALCSR